MVTKMTDQFRERSKRFLNSLVDKLENDGVSPRIQRPTFGRVSLQILIGNKRRNLRLNTIPESLLKLRRVEKE